jgi:predicted nucleic acid-binding protein
LIVYVETNFVLELAYLRPTSDNCHRLLDLAQDHRIDIVVSSFALVEARLAWQRNAKRRNRLHAAVRTELGELSRSRPLVDIPIQSQAFVAALIDTAQQDRARLEIAVETLAGIGTVTLTPSPTLARAYEVEQRLGLSPQDALVYASVIQHIESHASRDKLFVTQNRRDFLVVEDDLANYDCKLLHVQCGRRLRSEPDRRLTDPEAGAARIRSGGRAAAEPPQTVSSSRANIPGV